MFGVGARDTEGFSINCRTWHAHTVSAHIHTHMHIGTQTHTHLPSQVYVILFGVGERDTEGIYSLRAFGDDGLPQETIIVFETEEDAQRCVLRFTLVACLWL